MSRIDRDDLNDLTDILFTFFQGHDVSDLDLMVRNVKIRLALSESERSLDVGPCERHGEDFGNHTQSLVSAGGPQ